MKRTSRRTVLLKGGDMKRTSRRTVLLKGGDMKRTSRRTALLIDRNEDNSAAIKASKRSRYWNDPAVRLAKCASERGRGTAGVTELPLSPKGMLWHVVLTLY